MAHIYKRGETWWITYMVGGKKVYESLHTKNGREALEAQKRHEGLKRNGLIPVPSVTPIGPFLSELCEFWRKTRKCKGAETDISRLRGVFGPCCPALELPPHTNHKFIHRKNGGTGGNGQQPEFLHISKLEDLTSEIIASYLQRRIVRDGIDGKTANRIRGVLSSMFTYARKFHGYRCPQPGRIDPIKGVDRTGPAVERFKESDPPIVWLRNEQIVQQLDALADHPSLHAIVAVYIFAGLRREEALWLTPDDIDLEQKLIRVVSKVINGDRWSPKTGVDRTVPINTRLLEILKKYMQGHKGKWVFLSPEGSRWDTDNFSAHLRSVNESKGLYWSCGEYRHTFGSHLAQKGVSLFKISELMGNSPDICRRHYAKLMPQEMHDEVEF